ncbi:MAG: hypothetical protein R2838_11885 [Caldilineaceae bacterium]
MAKNGAIQWTAAALLRDPCGQPRLRAHDDRADGCLKCNSTLHLRGCYLCATQTVQSYKGTDTDLLELYRKAHEELNLYLNKVSATTNWSLAA